MEIDWMERGRRPSESGILSTVLRGNPDDEIVALEARLRDAQLSADVEVLDKLIHEDLLFTGPDGQLATKAQDLEAHSSGLVRFRSHEPKELRIRRVGGNVAVVALLAELVVEVAGSPSEGVYRYTRVWSRDNGRDWRVVAGHVSPVVLDPE
jgi:ketosteroid isomerase-like protein